MAHALRREAGAGVGAKATYTAWAPTMAWRRSAGDLRIFVRRSSKRGLARGPLGAVKRIFGTLPGPSNKRRPDSYAGGGPEPPGRRSVAIGDVG